MNRHPFDVFSAVLGVLAVAAGALVTAGTVDPFAGSDAGIWITVAALAVGLLMLPWGRRLRPATEPGDVGDDPVGADLEHDGSVKPGDPGR